jgi:hypothetical protein
VKVTNALATVVAVLGLAGCGTAGESATVASSKSPSATEPSSTPQLTDHWNWNAPENYDFVLESSCGESSFAGRFHVVVRDGRVADVQALDDLARSMLDQGYEDDVPTLSGLLDEVERVRDMGADIADVDRTADGRPEKIMIDVNTEAYDDEACYVISDYREGN